MSKTTCESDRRFLLQRLHVSVSSHKLAFGFAVPRTWIVGSHCLVETIVTRRAEAIALNAHDFAVDPLDAANRRLGFIVAAVQLTGCENVDFLHGLNRLRWWHDDWLHGLGHDDGCFANLLYRGEVDARRDTMVVHLVRSAGLATVRAWHWNFFVVCKF